MNKNQFNHLIALSAIAAICCQWLGFEFAFFVLKPLTTILIICMVSLFKTENSDFVTLVVVALIACLGGDVLLLDESRFAYGLASFLIAHFIFVYVFFKMAEGQLRYTALIVLLPAGLGFYWLLYPELGALAAPVTVYLVCILSMCWLGINLYLIRADSVSLLLCLAGLLFVFSDTVIAVNKFLLPFDLSQVVILATYWLSIGLIANAFTISAQLKYSVTYEDDLSESSPPRSMPTPLHTDHLDD